jgi:cytochrome c-type biogenesis protein CcmH
LVLLSGVFYLFPRARSGSTEADLDSANLEWFRLRRLELAAEGNDALDEDARLRLLEDEHLGAPTKVTSAQSFPVWVFLPLVALLASVLDYMLGAAQDVEIAERLQNLQEDMTPEETTSLIAEVEARSLPRPEKLH